MTFARRLLPTLLLPCFALATSSGCAPEDTRLFDEDGVWAVSHWSEDGLEFLQQIPQNTQNNAFLLNFNRDKGILAAAACAFQDGDNTPNSSTCRVGTSEADRNWECTCYSYEFEGSTITTTEFAPGDTAPPVGSADTEGNSGTSEITVADFTEVSNSYSFTPLPGPTDLDLDGLFGSNGVTAAYVFIKRFEGVFDESGCAEACFGG